MEVEHGNFYIFREVELTPTDENGVILTLEDEHIKDNHCFVRLKQRELLTDPLGIPHLQRWETGNGYLKIYGVLEHPCVMDVKIEEITDMNEEEAPISNYFGLPV